MIEVIVRIDQPLDEKDERTKKCDRRFYKKAKGPVSDNGGKEIKASDADSDADEIDASHQEPKPVIKKHQGAVLPPIIPAGPFAF
jgi:hypothetical protein